MFCSLFFETSMKKKCHSRLLKIIYGLFLGLWLRKIIFVNDNFICMEFNKLIDRGAEIERINDALSRQTPQFIVVYGRRRIGKSTLIKHILKSLSGSLYFLSDTSSESVQRSLFAKMVATVIDGFDKVVYPDWETLFRSMNSQLKERIAVCLDEFPYLVKSCEVLPSIIQKLMNEKCLKFDLILCGSSQQLMHGYVLNRQSPLYGLANEIIRMTPIPAGFVPEALACDAEQAVREYAVWGGIPRYWELRNDYVDFETAIKKVVLDPQGPLSEEPQRLLRDDMRDTVQAVTILTIIGNGANKLTEIATRAGKDATQISEPLGKLRDLGYVYREVPFGEDPKKSKKGIYHINDSLLRFYYQFIVPYRSIIELGRVDTVMKIVEEQLPQYVSLCWEELCRNYVSGNVINGIPYDLASRWWGKIFPPENKEGKMVELDVVAESFDKKHLLIGECKWTHQEDAERLRYELEQKVQYLPFVKPNQTVHIVLFLKEKPLRQSEEVAVFLPENVLKV